MDERSRNERGSSEERKLELRLGPPCGEDWSRSNKTERDHESSLLSLGYYSTTMSATPWSSSSPYQGQGGNNSNNNNKGCSSSSFLQFPTSTPVMSKEPTQSCCPKVIDLQNGDNKVPYSHTSSANNTAVPSTSQKRTAPGPVVGWPPIRSFRKNLSTSNTSNSKQSPQQQQQPESHNKVAGKKPIDNYGANKGLFVKINMDGVPIGRKVDLNAYDSYQNLSSAVDDLFRDLLAAQRDSCGGGVKKQQQQKEEEKTITGLLDGSGEYTLVYEDNEGDRMLVGDVPWHMFVSTVKRLRVLKSTELSAFTLGTTKQDKIST